MKEICPRESCTGCSACVNSCSKAAIKMVPDRLGFYFPMIDELLCVNCGLCEKSCPNNYPVKKAIPLESFVGHAVNSNEQISSTSGGIASVISRWCIQNGGVVYGCSAKDCMHVRHIRVTEEKDLVWLKGSKYVQSDMGTCFSQIKMELRNDKDVVFIGTPCQCAGLRRFLQKDYEKLYIIDFVCHGVPSQQILNEELKLHISEDLLQSTVLSFRRKVKKGNFYKTQYGIFLQSKSIKNQFEEIFPKNNYITGFLTGLTYRNSCYHCKFSNPERVSDITLGDYADRDKKYEYMEGKRRLLSMITVNTNKGRTLLSSVIDGINNAQIEYDSLVKVQGQLNHPIPKHKFRTVFEKNMVEDGYYKTISTLLKQDKRHIRKSIFISQIRDVLYTIPFARIFYCKLKHK